MKKYISIVTPCFNEADNIAELYERIRSTMTVVSDNYRYEHIVIDNASTDDTLKISKEIAVKDKCFKIIVNNRNYGPVRSPYHGLLSASGDAVILIAADLQDPPELILEFISKWEAGFDVVMAAKPKTHESLFMKSVRRIYYKAISYISETPMENNATGFGLFDRKVIDILSSISDPYPYFRGLVCDLGFSRCTVEFIQPKRKKGTSKASFYVMLDQALLAMTKHSKLPLRLMTILGLFLGALTLLISLMFLLLKLIYWNSFPLGLSPLLIGMFFIAAIQFFFMGILGEYVGMILTHQRNMPHVIERERINFSSDDN